MTKCSKTVQEKEFKFFPTYLDALMNQNYFLDVVEVEGNMAPDQIESKTNKEIFLLRNFTRGQGIDKFIEKVYVLST